MLKRKDLLGLYDLSVEEITEILDTATDMKNNLIHKNTTLSILKGKTLTTLFYENSTRTRISFELAAKYLGASTINMSVSTSSVKKGETLIDTGKTLDAMKNDFMVIRHAMGGAPYLLAKNVNASVINAGDGMNEHPTQALLDMFTIQEKFNALKGLKIAMLGDIKHSRVAKSNILGLTKFGSSVMIYAPNTLIPEGIEKMGAIIAKTREQAIENAHVVMGLRIQLERQQGGAFPSLSEYSKFYGVNEETLKLAAKDAIVMHPGPVNRGVEMTTQVIDHTTSKINEQVLNGLAVRMAILSLLAK